MKKIFKSQLFLQVAVATMVATLATAGFVGAATTIGNNISTGGTVTAYGATSIGGALTATSTLEVTGATTLSSTLSVAGATAFAGNASTTGSAVLKSATINSDTGAISFGDENLLTTGTLGAGATTLGSTLAVTGATTLTGATTIYGATSIGGALTATSTFKIGTLSSSVPGSGFIVSDTTNRVVDINVDDNDVASADTAKTISAGRFRLMRYADTVAEDYALHGLVKYSELTKSRWGAGVIGAAETTGAVTLSNLTTGVLGRFGTAATLTLTGASDRIAAVTAFNNNSVALAGSGKSVGLLVMETDVGTPIDLDYGLEIKSSVATTGIKIGTATTDIELQNAETISNGTNGTVAIANDGGASVAITPATGTITPSGGTISIGGIMTAATTTATTAMVLPVVATALVDDTTACTEYTAGALIWTTNGGGGLFVCDGSVWQAAMN